MSDTVALTIPNEYVRDFALLAEIRYPDDATRGAMNWTWQVEARSLLGAHLEQRKQEILEWADGADERRIAREAKASADAVAARDRVNAWAEV